VAVAVTDGEEVAMPQIQHVWVRQVSVLVYFVRVVGRYSTLGCERELGDYVVDASRVSCPTSCFLLG